MKTIRIYKRTILKPTGIIDHPQRKYYNVSIFYDSKEKINNNEFVEVLNTRSKKKLKEYYLKLGNSVLDMFIKNTIDDLSLLK